MSNTSLPPAPPPPPSDSWRQAIIRAGLKRLSSAMSTTAALETYSRLSGLTAMHDEITEAQSALWEVHRALGYLYRGDSE